MAVAHVTAKGGGVVKGVVIALILLVVVIYLIPIYWVFTSSFKPFTAVTAVPPKVFFKPEITSYIKLFTKRSIAALSSIIARPISTVSSPEENTGGMVSPYGRPTNPLFIFRMPELLPMKKVRRPVCF
jgi:ABC-type maltose transport system permease subunit